MAKRKSNTQKPPPIHRWHLEHEGTLDPGIVPITLHRLVYDPAGNVTLQDSQTSRQKRDAKLAMVETEAQQVLAKLLGQHVEDASLIAHAITSSLSLAGRRTNEHNPQWVHAAMARMNDQEKALVVTAVDVLHSTANVRVALKNGDVDSAVTLAVELGELYQLLFVRPRERDAKSGAASQHGAQKGRDKIERNKNTKLDEFHEEYKRQHVGRVSHTSAVRRAASELQLKERAAWTYAAELGLNKQKK
jgi:hypothetical protein